MASGPCSPPQAAASGSGWTGPRRSRRSASAPLLAERFERLDGVRAGSTRSWSSPRRTGRSRRSCSPRSSARAKVDRVRRRAARRAPLGAGRRRGGARRTPPSILVHDAARPLVADEVVERVLAALREGWDGAVPGLPLADTVKRVRGATRGRDARRATSSCAVQTPQAFVAACSRTRSRASAGDGLRVARRGARRPRAGRRGRPAAAEGHRRRGSRAGRDVAGVRRLSDLDDEIDDVETRTGVIRAVVFDVGETLVDEAGWWAASAPTRWRAALHADRGVPSAALVDARRAPQPRPGSCSGSSGRARRRLRGRRAATTDAMPCLRRLRARRLRVGRGRQHGRPTSRSRSASRETSTSRLVGAAGASRSRRRAFFERLPSRPGRREPAEVAYVGDRVDNDVVPALAAGHGRRPHRAAARGATCTSRRPAAIRIRLAAPSCRRSLGV